MMLYTNEELNAELKNLNTSIQLKTKIDSISKWVKNGNIITPVYYVSDNGRVYTKQPSMVKDVFDNVTSTPSELLIRCTFQWFVMRIIGEESGIQSIKKAASLDFYTALSEELWGVPDKNKCKNGFRWYFGEEEFKEEGTKLIEALPELLTYKNTIKDKWMSGEFELDLEKFSDASDDMLMHAYLNHRQVEIVNSLAYSICKNNNEGYELKGIIGNKVLLSVKKRFDISYKNLVRDVESDLILLLKPILNNLEVCMRWI